MQYLKPTRRQKQKIKKKGFAPEEWLVQRKQTPGKLTIVHRESSIIKEISL